MNRGREKVGVFHMLWRIMGEQPEETEIEKELENQGLNYDKIAKNVMKRIDKPVKTNNNGASGTQKINEENGKVKKQQREQEQERDM